jgi:hypothetical protein
MCTNGGGVNQAEENINKRGKNVSNIEVDVRRLHPSATEMSSVKEVLPTIYGALNVGRNMGVILKILNKLHLKNCRVISYWLKLQLQMTRLHRESKGLLRQQIQMMKRQSWLHRRTILPMQHKLLMIRYSHRLRELLRQQIQVMKRWSWLHRRSILTMQHKLQMKRYSQ